MGRIRQTVKADETPLKLEEVAPAIVHQRTKRKSQNTKQVYDNLLKRDMWSRSRYKECV
jgi:hypothetical protein